MGNNLSDKLLEELNLVIPKRVLYPIQEAYSLYLSI